MGKADRGTQSKLRLTQCIARACWQTPHRAAIPPGSEALSRADARVLRIAGGRHSHGRQLLCWPDAEVVIGAAVEAIFEPHDGADPPPTLVQWRLIG